MYATVDSVDAVCLVDSQVKADTLNLQRLMKAVTALDVASARAGHATWLGAVRPTFLSTEEAAQVRRRPFGTQTVTWS